MLDRDLAMLYKCTNGTKDINKAVKRNIERFPDDFYFQLTEEETLSLSRFQFGTLNRSLNKRGSNIKYLPYAFTEEGVAMLSSCLRSDIAKSVSVEIMRSFVTMRKYIASNLIGQKYINNMAISHEETINKKDDIPETGDNIMRSVWMFIFSSLGTLVGIDYLYKKNKKKNIFK